MTPSNKWHLDKRVPIAMLFALLANLLAGIWYAAKIDSRVAALEISTRDNNLVLERLVRVETQLDGLKDAVNRIDQSVTKIADRK
ncbi:MAG: hypothetical protein K0R98_2030 [Rickettsiaceae bacterium]|jgi:hypothetical protein|nr:hypothetical protein [Rickettsiaceae bacterium]